MIPGSAGSRPSASEGSVSVPASKASNCSTAILTAYDVFGRAAGTGAIKVMMTR